MATTQVVYIMGAAVDSKVGTFSLQGEPVLQPLDLMQLPDELKLAIIDFVDRKRDLYNLSLTCRTFEDLTFARLYHDVDVEIPQSRLLTWNTGGLPTFRHQVVQSMRTLSVHNGHVDVRNPVYSRKRKSDAVSVDDYVCSILARVPRQQLASFSFLHKSPMPLKMLELVASHHGRSLRELAFYELELHWRAGVSLPRQLRSLECRSIHEGEALGKMVQANAPTLEVLSLGQENELIEQYRRSRIGFLEQITQPLDSFTSVMKLHNLPKLREISLYGIDISSLIPTSILEAMFFCQLESLTLESCSGSAGLLESLAGTFHYAQTSEQIVKAKPKLRSFFFRHEAPSTPLKESLIRFLVSFSGLTTLSLLFENATFLERPSALINEHGATLESLVLESRIQPREHLGLDTSRPFGVGGYSQELWEEAISDICRHCPKLIELGMGFPWDDEMVRIRKTNLPNLQSLRTMHVRNFPESSVLSQLGDYSIKEYAQKWVDWVFPGLVGGKKPHLETLSIGPTLYESRWKSNATRREPPEFLRTHHFWVDWAQTRFGRWSPMITGVSEKYMEEARGQAPLSGVFQQVWLR